MSAGESGGPFKDFWGGGTGERTNERKRNPPKRWPSQENTDRDGSQPRFDAGAMWDDDDQTVLDPNGYHELPHAELSVTSGHDEGVRIVISKVPFSIGRGLDNDLVVKDISVSRDHLRIEYDGEHFKARDLQSGNGTIVDGDHSDDGVVLYDGAVLDLGYTVMSFAAPLFERPKKVPKPPPIPRQATPPKPPSIPAAATATGTPAIPNAAAPPRPIDKAAAQALRPGAQRRLTSLRPKGNKIWLMLGAVALVATIIAIVLALT